MNVGVRLGTNSHSYAYVFKIGNSIQVWLFMLMFATDANSEFYSQYIESGCMIEVKPSLPYKYV